MKKVRVAFVTVKDYENLGIGYMAAVLAESGIETRVVDFNNKKEDILKILKKLNPQIIGFAVIYQYHINRFIELISYLRKKGVESHFTAGGHYASLKYQELFEFLPTLDSIVRFEGEYTLLELVNKIYSGEDWKHIDGIAFQKENKAFSNQLRPLLKDLDALPFPIRSPLTGYAFNKKYTTILAGRGCVHNCSFCNLREFYRQSSGPAKRLRKPEMVVNEMEYLFHKEECRVFLFEDDDFPVKISHRSKWIIKFCNRLKCIGLNNKIMWKINCRPDEIDEETFAMMKKNGLYLVFIGIDDGTDRGLSKLNKHLTVSESMNGINILKRLGIGFDYGFMLFQPSTTFSSLNENLDFLREMCYDGYTPVAFNKMMPYYDTLVESELRRMGRIKGPHGQLDYDFPDESMNRYYDYITDCFVEWLRSPDGLVNISKWARNYLLVYSHYFGSSPGFIALNREIIRIISESNIFILDSMKELALLFESGEHKKDDKAILKNFRNTIKSNHKQFKEQINRTMSRLLTFSTN